MNNTAEQNNIFRPVSMIINADREEEIINRHTAGEFIIISNKPP